MVEDAFYAPSTSPAAFSGAAFDRYLLHGAEADASIGSRGAGVGGAKEGGGGLGKKLLSFPWSRSDKKQAPQQQQATAAQAQPPSPTVISHPFPPQPPQPALSAALPLGFPAPPPTLSSPAANARASPQLPQQHPSVAMFASSQPSYQPPNSNTSLSTSGTTSSFASTNIFASSTDGWESATSFGSLTSSPESGRDSCGEGGVPQQRMWRVKGLREQSTGAGEVLSALIEEDEFPSVPTRRNSTPVPRMVAMMLADPETPPRHPAGQPKRWSTSSTKPSPTSPPFDPTFEKAAAQRRRQQSTTTAQDSPDGEEADDEVSPPRQRRNSHQGGVRRDRSAGELSLPSLPSSARIPSICFEGISMDAVFAEVEKNMKSETASEEVDASQASDAKRARRRSRVLSMYKPLSYGEGDDVFHGQQAQPASVEVEQTAPLTSSSPSLDSFADSTFSSSSSVADSMRSGSVTPTAGLFGSAFDAPRPRPYPRRTSSRPAPLNVAAANSIPVWSPSIHSAPLNQGYKQPYSPTTSYGAFSPVPNQAPPMDLVSPPLAGAFSPQMQDVAFPSPTLPPPSPALSTLGEPFNPDPSPAASTASTFKPCDIPELLVCPPSPTQEEIELEQERERRARAQPFQRERRSSAAGVTMVNGPTRVTVVPDKRMVRVSTRAAPRRRGTYTSPPLHTTPSFSSPSSPSQPSSPVLPSFDPTAIPTSPAASTTPPQTPTLVFTPAFEGHRYTPPKSSNSSSLAVSQQQSAEEDSSDCEESLHNMLMRLNRPHTPPRTSAVVKPKVQAEGAEADPQTEPAPTPSLSLTELALELHTSSQSRLSMLAREMGAAVSPPSVSTATFEASKENRIIPTSTCLSTTSGLAPSPSTSKRDRRLSRICDSDDSATRFGDAPALKAGPPKPLSPSMIYQSAGQQSLCGEQGGGRNFESASSEAESDMDLVDDNVDLESEIDRTLASLQSASISSQPAPSSFDDSLCQPPSSASSSSHMPRSHAHSDSLSSFTSSSSLDYLRDSAPLPSLAGTATTTNKLLDSRPPLPRSDSQRSSFTDSSFDSGCSSEEEIGEVGIVCLGERVSCMYDVGVIGMAM
ncbi:hypothetical protein JCM11641_006735 [Rhodosporidiobolus odoratus]